MLFIHCLKYFCIFPPLIPIFMLRYIYEKKKLISVKIARELILPQFKLIVYDILFLYQ